MAQPPPTPRPANRLARESSPYLLQHAHNPVDWWPWGPGAFAEARRRDVPVFLSIGYSTCYWCHVMERESFESEAVARLMNERFVCVKVDREERPDVDDIYMAAVQIMTGRGGWPMSVFLEPASLKPYWCGTYFPPEPAHGLPSFPQVLDGMSRAWRERRDEVLKQAESVGEAVREHLATAHEPRPVGAPQVGKAISALLTTHDRVRGGFADAPKFPQPSYVDLLLRFLPNAGDPESKAAAEAAVRLTLDRMAIGGMFDQAGGGFHRYSVDAEWTVPHFEKMLYDNALLAALYARAARDLDDRFYARVARRTLDYVRREMTDAVGGGGFHSAQDAEVDGREGGNYLWTPEQVRAVLPDDDGEFAIRVYGLDRGPNFRDPHHPDAPPSNVLRLDDRPERVAAGMGLEPDAFLARIDRVNAALLAARQTRKQPRQDDKVLAGWNGLMIGAMAAASASLREPAYRESAIRAADFILANMRTPDGGLLRSWRADTGSVPAFLEDYAAVISGLVELHRVADDSAGRYLAAATDLARIAGERFGDGRGGYYDTRAEQADLFVRTRSTYDGAVPCGSSQMLSALIDLHEATGRREHLDAATRCLASISHAIAESPVSTAHATVGLLRLLTIDAAAVAAAVPGTPADPGAKERAGFTPVVVFASTDRVAVSTREPATLTLRLRIAEGYHINAADPGPGGETLIALRVGITGGTGVEVFADYPKGDAIDGPTGRILIHLGEIELPVVLERSGTWSGRPLITVAFQACTDTECLAPTTVELDVALDPLD